VKRVRFSHKVVDSLPEPLQPNTLYVTADEDVAGHLCACGCGREVITPLSPTDWSISVDRRGASLEPSIGNWSFPCRSHYFIRSGAVAWAGDMSNKAVAQGRQRDKAVKRRYYERQGMPLPRANSELATPLPPRPAPRAADKSLGQKLKAWWKRLLDR
jgi:hypothetical protein